MTGPGKTGLIVIFSKFRFCLKRIAHDINKRLAKFQQSVRLYAGVTALNRVALLCMKVRKYLFYDLSRIIGYESKQIGWHIADKSSPTVVSLNRFIAHGVNISARTGKHLRSRDKKLLDQISTCGIMNRIKLRSWWHSSVKWWKSGTGIGRESLLQSNPPVHFRYCYYKMASWTPNVQLHVMV